LIVALLLLGILAIPLLRGHVPVRGDLGQFHLPLRHFYARCLAQGEAFDWMPSMYTGLFVTGEGESGCYHPGHWLLYRWLPLHTAFAIEAFIHFPLMFAGMVVFLRRHVGSCPAILGGLIYTFSTNNLCHSEHINYVAVLAHLPWLLWLMDSAYIGPGLERRRAIAGIAFLTGSQLLLGNPQTMSFSLLAEALYAVVLGSLGRPRFGGWLAIAAGKLLGALVGAVQVLATYSFLASTNRGTFDPYFASYLPSRLVQIVAPDLLSCRVLAWAAEPAYFGAPAVLLIMWWLSGGWRSGAVGASPRPAVRLPSRNALALYGLLLAVLAGWLATGCYGHLYYWQTRLPLVGQLRAPCRYVNLVDFGAAILAAVAFGAFSARIQAGTRLPWRSLVLPWAGVAAAIVIAVAFAWTFPRAESSNWLTKPGAAPGLFVAAAVALSGAARGQRGGLYALILLAGADLGYCSLQNPIWGQTQWRKTPKLESWNAATLVPPVPQQGRILNYAWDPNRILLRGESLINGYRGGLEPRKLLDYEQLVSLRVAGAAWYCKGLLGESEITGLELVAPGWYRVPDPLPRARLVVQVVVSERPDRDLLRIDVANTALVTHPLDLSDVGPGQVTLLQDKPGAIRVRAQAPGRQLLTISESFDPGWQATAEGQPTPVERVNGDFLGCVVPEGTHEVELVFRPPALRLGRVVSCLGLLMALAVGMSGLRLRPKRDLPSCLAEPGEAACTMLPKPPATNRLRFLFARKKR
jgi:hypothetical protein